MAFERPGISAAELQPAGFWLRVFAYLVDLSVLTIPSLLIGDALVESLASKIGALVLTQNSDPIAPSMIVDLLLGTVLAILISLVIQLLISVFYNPLFESSKFQATPGKLLFKLIVTDESQAPVSFGQAFARNAARGMMVMPFLVGVLMATVAGGIMNSPGLAGITVLVAVLLTLLIGLIQYPLAAFTEHKQALHDLIAHTLVVRRESMSMPEICVKAAMAAIIFLIVSGYTPMLSSTSSDSEPPPSRVGLV